MAANATPLPTTLVPYGAPALAALSEAIRAAQSHDPLAPVTVAVPSNLAGLAARRVLGRAMGLVNVRFLVLARLAELLGAPLLAAQGGVPLTRWRRFAALRSALANQPGDLAPVAHHASTLQALDAAFRSLRDAPDSALERIARQGGTAAAVASLCLRFRKETAGCYSEDDLASSAASAIRSRSVALDDIGHVIVFLPGPLSGAMRSMLAALREIDAASIIVGVTGDAAADGPALAAVASNGPLPLPGIEPPLPVHVVVAADPAEEVRSAIRMAMAAARNESVEPASIAMLFTSADYGPLLHEQLSAAGIPHNGPPAGVLAGSLAGRVLLGMFNIQSSGFARADVFRWLADAPIRDRHGLVPSRRWESLARDAGIVRGIEQWRARLVSLRSTNEEAAAEARAQGDDDRARWCEHDIEEIDRLGAFIGELHGSLADWPSDPARALAHTLNLLQRYLGSERAHDNWPPDEAEAYERVVELLREAAATTPASPAVDLVAFRDAVAWLLQQPGVRLGPFGQGIFVAPLRTAVGMHFDRVFIVGMGEGQAPLPPRADPLVPESEHEQLGVPSVAELAAEERRCYLAAVAAAPRTTLLCSRADLRLGRARHPSRWLLEACSRHAGRRIGSAELERLPRSAWFTAFPSFAAAIEREAEPANPVEYDLRLLLHGPRDPGRNQLVHLPEMEQVARGIEAGKAHMLLATPRPLTRWDGRAGPVASPSSPGARPISPTALEAMAVCPFRYFLRYQLGVREQEDVVEELTITPLVRGALIHRILERFFREAHALALDPPDGEPWGPDARERLQAIAAEECARDESRGLTGTTLLWRLEQRRILEQVDLLLTQDSQLRIQGFRFHAAELEFGGPGGTHASLALDASRTIRFRGRVDRVDRGPLGSFAVYDYKTGRPDLYERIEDSRDPFDHGQRLQLAIYALALGGEQQNPPVAAYYWFVGSEKPLIGYALSSETLDHLREVLAALDRTISLGLFPINPGKQAANCRHCPFDRLCIPTTLRQERLLQVRDMPGLEGYVALAGLADLAEEDQEQNDLIF